MSASLYDSSIPPLTLGLTNLAAIIDKGAAFADAKKVEPKVLADSRLIADMFPLSRQVQIVCDTAKGAAGLDLPKHEDTETTLIELKARIQKTLDFLGSINPAQLAGAESREVVLQFPRVTLKFSGADYLHKFVLPNFYFHITIAYGILRSNGVELGKGDYLGAIQ